MHVFPNKDLHNSVEFDSAVSGVFVEVFISRTGIVCEEETLSICEYFILMNDFIFYLCHAFKEWLFEVNLVLQNNVSSVQI